jgi:hypothetical protein
VLLGPQATFDYTNPDGTMIRLTGGTVGASVTLADTKSQGGSISVALAGLGFLQNPSYGTTGEAAVAASGSITEGTGVFTLALTGFTEIADVSATFTAQAVSSATGNPLTLSLFGQGNQLAFPTPGTISHTAGWLSTDAIPLSNGSSLQIGSFYLSTVGTPTTFSYGFGPDGTVSGTYTIAEQYLFVNTLTAPPTGANLRASFGPGTVSSVFQAAVVPEPAPLQLLGGALGILGGLAAWRRSRAA